MYVFVPGLLEMLDQCSLIRRAPFFADDMGHKREAWKLITEVLLMRGYLPCVAREQYENERSDASSIHHSQTVWGHQRRKAFRGNL